MATPLSEAIAQFLESRGFGSYRDSDQVLGPMEVAIALEALPSSSSQVIVITQYSGPTVDTQLPWDEPHLQLRLRGTDDPSVSRGAAQRIFDLLNGFGPADMFGCHIQLIVGLGSGPTYVGQDATTRRHHHVVNFAVTVFNPNRRTA